MLAFKVKSYEEIINIAINSEDDPGFVPEMKSLCGRVFYGYDISEVSEEYKAERIRIKDFVFNFHWLIRGDYDYKTQTFTPAPDDQQGYDMSKYIKHRKDWVPKLHPVKIEDSVASLIVKACERCDLDDSEYPYYFACRNSYYDDGYYRSYDISYDFTWLCFAESQRGRISGIGYNRLQSMAWESVCGSAVELSEPVKIARVDNKYYQYAVDYSPNSDTRVDKGTYIKPAKLIRALFPDLSESKCTTLASAVADILRERANPDLSCLEISDKPSEIYTRPSAFDSCMRNQDPCRFHIYDDLPDTRILYLMEDGYLIGRALLHHNVTTDRHESDGVPDTINMMDRIYFKNSEVLALFRCWAIKNGYWFKRHQSISCHEYNAPDGSENIYYFQAYIPCEDLRGKYQEVPYIDSFYKLRRNGDNFFLCTSSALCGLMYVTEMQSTGGNDDENYITRDGRYRACCCCDNDYRRDDMREIDGEWYCEDCFDERFSYCDDCEEYHERDCFHEVANGDWVCDGCFENHYVLCEQCEVYFYEDDVTRHEDGCDYCDSCYEEVLAEESVEEEEVLAEESVEEEEEDSDNEFEEEVKVDSSEDSENDEAVEGELSTTNNDLSSLEARITADLHRHAERAAYQWIGNPELARTILRHSGEAFTESQVITDDLVDHYVTTRIRTNGE